MSTQGGAPTTGQTTWDRLKEVIPEDAFARVKERFELQLDNAREWRDQVNSYFYRKSFIEDEKGRTIY